MQVTWYGHVETPNDALKLFEACLGGVRQSVPRRLQNNERQHLIRSGCVFVYEEHASGIKRWTDGVNWSSSRVLGNFLVYRQMDGELATPGAKRKGPGAAASRSKHITNPGEPYPRMDNSKHEDDSDAEHPTPSPPQPPVEKSAEEREKERALVGSLIDLRKYKEGGLVKKTMSIDHRGRKHRLVSYYTIEDVVSGRLTTPSQDPQLKNIMPRLDLIAQHRYNIRGDDQGDEYMSEYLAAADPGSYGELDMLIPRRPVSFQGPLDLGYPPTILNSNADEAASSRHEGNASLFPAPSYSSGSFSGSSYSSAASSGAPSYASTYSSSTAPSSLYPVSQSGSQVYYSSSGNHLPTSSHIKQDGATHQLYSEIDYGAVAKQSAQQLPPPLSLCTDARSGMPQYAHYGGQITPISATPLPALLPLGDLSGNAGGDYGSGRGSVWSEDSGAGYAHADAYKLEQGRWNMVTPESE